MKSFNTMFNSLKKELFFIFRLFQEGYGPRYWWPYAKNRFFGNYLFRRLPRHDYQADPDFELHTICSKQDLWMLAWMLRSFLIMSKLKPVVIIHDDGTLDKATEELIQSKFPNTKIMFREETTKRILAMPEVPDIVKQSRVRCHFFLDKLTNILVFSKAKRVIASDTDILYYKTPTEVVDFILGKTSSEALVQRQINEEIIFDLMVDDFYVEKHKPNARQIALMNGGYVIIDKDKFNLEQLAEFLEHTKRPFEDYFIEMAGWACLSSQVNFEFLSPTKYAIKGFLNDSMAMKHYTSPRRYEMFAYGIDKAKKATEKMEFGKSKI